MSQDAPVTKVWQKSVNRYWRYRGNIKLLRESRTDGQTDGRTDAWMDACTDGRPENILPSPEPSGGGGLKTTTMMETFLLGQEMSHDSLILDGIHRMCTEHKSATDSQLTGAGVQHSTHPASHSNRQRSEFTNSCIL